MARPLRIEYAGAVCHVKGNALCYGLTPVLIVVGAALGLILGSIYGYQKGKSDFAIESFDTYRGDLVVYYGFPEFRNIELKEFLKARYYYFANRVPSGYMESPYDYGSVDFKGLTIGIGPTTPLHEYDVFKKSKLRFKEAKFISNTGVTASKTNAISQER